MRKLNLKEINIDGVINITICIGVVIFLLIYLLRGLIPVVNKQVSSAKDIIKEEQQSNYYASINNYVTSRSDYYYTIEGSTYCIPIRELVVNGVYKESDVNNDLNDIIEADYKEGSFTYSINNDCKEK